MTFRRYGLPLIIPIVILGMWLTWSNVGTSRYFPPLQDILATFATDWFSSNGLAHVVSSLTNMVLGYVLAVVLGIVFGFLIGRIQWLREYTQPMLDFIRAIPAPAILPFTIMLLGIGPEQKVGVIIFGAIFPILLNTIDGVNSVDHTVEDMSRIYRIRLLPRIFKIILPAASPQIVAGCRTSLSFALLLMVVSEMVSSFQGIGYYTIDAQRSYQYTAMWSGMIMLSILGFLLNKLFDVVETRVLRWQNSQNQTLRAS